MLAQFPRSGRLLPEFPERDEREVIVGNYRVIYRLQEKQRGVEILAVVHGARQLTEEFVERDGKKQQRADKQE